MIGLPLGAQKSGALSVKVGPEAYDSASRVKLGPFGRPLRKGISTSLSRVRLSDYGDGENALAEQLDCVFPARLRGQVMVSGSEPGVPPYPGSLPTCNPAPMAAFYVHDINDTDSTYVSILPGCSRVLQQNGCSNTKCDPRDTTLTAPYPVPAGVTLPAGASCVQFHGCPDQYPVVFCVTDNQGHDNDQNWGVLTLFWDFINALPSAQPCLAGQGYQSGACAPCPSDETACEDFCVNEQTDPNNCGACGTVCAAGATCQSGVCTCPSGETACAGACVNEQTDLENCGTCNTRCVVGCQAGVCSP